jgi:hypothetical protein
MHLSPTSRPSRARRLIAISAAAVAVMIAPTACDYGGYGNGSSANDMRDMGDMGNMPGMDHGAEQQPVVVPVANTSDASAAGDRRGNRWRNRPAGNTAPATTTTTAAPAPGDPAATPTTSATAPATDPNAVPPAAGGLPGAAGTVAAGGRDGKNNGLDILGRDCSKSNLTPHNGFQSIDKNGGDVSQGQGIATCVSTQMGEVAAEDQLPSLLIVDSPRFVGMNQAFTLKVSTRNLVRDRFLGAAKGGYYLESSFLNGKGLQRGHFHTACRILDTTKLAPSNPQAAPAFFVATEDGGGGNPGQADVVTIPVPAIGKPGILQCTSWAGDGSHRTPMMTRANETPAIDSVRIFVTRRNQPVRYDAAAANADAKANIAAQGAAGQGADAKPGAPAAPNAAGTPNTPVDEAGNALSPDAAAAPGDAAPPVADAAPAPDAATDAPAPAEDGAPAGN